LSAVVLAGLGCMAPEGKPSWGENAIQPVSGERLLDAAKDALLDPQTWVPAAGALVLSIDDWDREVSDWAVEHTPVFGSEEGASKASDSLLAILTAETVITALATPSGHDPWTWADAKAKGLGLEVGALGVNCMATDAVKTWVGRGRPDGTGGKSFPSGHASGGFATATLSNRNLNSIDMPGIVRQTIQIGNLGLASGVAWARVEGRHHYPSDVLAGAALGHFISAFFYDAFLNPRETRGKNTADLTISPLDGGAAIALAFRF
jgi:hypothetical protein